MPEDRQRDLLAPDHFQQLARARNGLLSIQVERTELTIWPETVLVRHGING
jgi:hypothetical protein